MHAEVIAEEERVPVVCSARDPYVNVDGSLSNGFVEERLPPFSLIRG
jgi:hypothetical protein